MKHVSLSRSIGVALIGAVVGNVALSSCASPRTTDGERAATSETVLEAASANRAPEHLPFPYTPEAIRDANPAGTTMLYRVEAMGEPAHLDRVRFLESTAEFAVIEAVRGNAQGGELQEPRVERATWTELRDHATFLAHLSERTRATCSVPAGDFRCWLYTVRMKEGDASIVRRFYFADEKPGAPVYFETEANGTRVMSSELLEFHSPAPR